MPGDVSLRDGGCGVDRCDVAMKCDLVMMMAEKDAGKRMAQVRAFNQRYLGYRFEDVR